MAKNYFEKIVAKHHACSDGKPSIALLDIDDTLVDCRYRKKLVLDAYAKTIPDNHTYKQKIADIKISQLEYRVYHSLDNIGVYDEDLRKSCFEYWLDHYFSKPYFLQDKAFPGAEEFTHKLAAAGIKLVYLTARDEPQMGFATREFLKNSAFYFDTQASSLVMKKDPKEPDHQFKKRALSEIKTQGRVIVALENELKHLNEMADTFGEALVYWRNTRYSPNPPPAHERVEILPEF